MIADWAVLAARCQLRVRQHDHRPRCHILGIRHHAQAFAHITGHRLVPYQQRPAVVLIPPRPGLPGNSLRERSLIRAKQQCCLTPAVRRDTDRHVRHPDITGLKTAANRRNIGSMIGSMVFLRAHASDRNHRALP